MVKVYGLDRFQRAFRQRSGNRHFLNLQLDGVGHFDYHEVIGNLRHLAGDTTAGDHFITFLQAADQTFVLFGTLGLWTPDHQIEDDQKAEQKLPFKTTTSRTGSRCGAFSESSGDKKAHVTLLLQGSLKGWESIQRRRWQPAFGIEGIDKGGQCTLLNSLAQTSHKHLIMP